MPARFEILRPLEEDSASTLFLIRDEKRGAEACLRRFKTKNAQEIAGLTELFNQLAGIDSSHVEKAVDFGADKDGFYVVTDVPAASETLEAVLERGPLTAEEFEVVTLQLLDALDALHEQAVVHGSIRADYVRIITGKKASDWHVTLQGFGQGFATKDDSKEAQVRAYRCTAPEQWADGTTRRRTDVYALGCVLYEALAARPPFDGRAIKEIRHKHIGHDLAPLQKLANHVPSWMCAWVMHLMAADPEQRPRKAAAARELFERREAPALPELPPRADTPAETVSSTPPVTLSAQPVSAPVMLPARQPGARHATSSTIPIPAGPHVVAASTRRPKPAPAPRKSYTLPRKPPTANQASNMKYIIITASAVVLMLLVFMLPRCGQQPEPAKGKPAQKQKK